MPTPNLHQLADEAGDTASRVPTPQECLRGKNMADLGKRLDACERTHQKKCQAYCVEERDSVSGGVLCCPSCPLFPPDLGGPLLRSQHDPGSYGDSLGSDYDVLYPADSLETAAAVDLIESLAAEHREPSVLEFGVGTGRLALELDRRGLRVVGIDASPRMLSALRSKAPAARIKTVLGDYVSTRVEETFSVVAIVFNAVLDERGLDAQLGIFANAAAHLEPGGKFVVEAFVLPEHSAERQWSLLPRYVGEDHVELQFTRFDLQSRIVERVLLHLRPEGPEFISVRDYYTSPAGFDIIAHVTGFRCVARYSSWIREPFTAQSRRHVSVYERC